MAERDEQESFCLMKAQLTRYDEAKVIFQVLLSRTVIDIFRP